MTTRSITTKEAAKLLRADLKRRFPTTKFSVRFERYSMGSHINVSWTDGPPVRLVEEIAAAFSGSRFDGMTDSSYYVNSWLLPNGSAVHAQQDRDSRPTNVVSKPPVPGAELVSFHGSLPHCSRELSAGYVATCEKVWAKLSDKERRFLIEQPRFPAWENRSEGYRMAYFLNADDVTPQRKAAA